jgi:hypothetical protein
MAVKNFVSFTSGTETVDGPKGQNNKMERGGSVVSNPIWEPAAPNSPKQRLSDPKYAEHSDMGRVSVRDTPVNQHGLVGKVEPAKPQPDLKGHNAAPHTKRP